MARDHTITIKGDTHGGTRLKVGLALIRLGARLCRYYRVDVRHNGALLGTVTPTARIDVTFTGNSTNLTATSDA